jgi:hypothetical protein
MVKVTLELSELEISMLLHCIEAAIDTKHMPDEDLKKAKKIRQQLSKYV